MFLANKWQWRILVGGAFLSVAFLGFSAWILYQGVSNPPRAENLLWQDNTMAWVKPSTTETEFFTSPQRLALTDFSIEVQARLLTTANPQTAWGIWLTTQDTQRLLIGINGAQYVTARLCPLDFQGQIEQCPPAIEPNQSINTYWKFFHLIRPVGNENQIHINFFVSQKSNQLKLYLNNESMWNIEYDLSDDEVIWGLWLQPIAEQGEFIEWIQSAVWINKPN